MVYVGGVEVPLVELFLGVGVISIIILIELIAILVLMSFHMKTAKRLEEEMGKLTHALLTVQGKEYAELAKLKGLEQRQENLISRLGLKRLKAAAAIPKPKKRVTVSDVKKEKKSIKKKMVKARGQNALFKKIDAYFKGGKK